MNKVAFDRVVEEGEVIQLKVRLTEEETEELYVLIATQKPKIKIVNYDTIGDGTTSTLEVIYPDVENITNYYSLDNGITWNIYNAEIDILNTEIDNFIVKIEYNEGKTINKEIKKNVQIITSSLGDSSYREGNVIPKELGWKELTEIAESISNLAKDQLDEENTNIITEDTNELVVRYKGIEYTLGVGDYTYLDEKKVRILGFNHDELSNDQKACYGGNNKYAGISFEYVDFLEGKNLKEGKSEMNKGNSNAGGWRGSLIYNLLNNTTILNEIKKDVKVKKVQKRYISVYDDSESVTISDDYLWLLSCSEIWNQGRVSGGYGYAIAKEGEQYKFYKNINAEYNRDNNKLKKPSSVENTENYVTGWWLRSPRYTEFNYSSKLYGFCYCNAKGFGDAGWSESNLGVAPGFAI